MRGIHTVIVSSSIALAACALNQPPPSEELRAKALPNVKTPVQWASQGGAAAASADNWLASFNDPALDALVREAIEYNSDLRMAAARVETARSEEHTSELQSPDHLVCRLLLEK